MFRMAMICLAVLCGSSLCDFAAQPTAKPSPTIDVTAPNDFARVNAVNNALSVLSDKVSACVKAGRKPTICQCSYPQELLKLRQTYASLIAQHPGWKDKLLTYRRVNKEGRSVSGTLVLQNLRRQLEILKCD
jgi:hypothetical protein